MEGVAEVGLKVLGPLELVVHGQTVEVSAPRKRIVLAALALNANRSVSLDQLIDAVWDTSPPETARSQIQACVSSLRGMLAAASAPMRIQTIAPGYRLEIDGEDLDVVTFDRLVEEARALTTSGDLAAAADTWRAALALWRGSVLADVRTPRLERLAVVLEERRLAALESLASLELDLGQHARIATDFRALVEEHPWRERMYVFLALALYRSGRQAEALEVCRRARSILVEELGIDPGWELRELEQAILVGDRALDHTDGVTPDFRGGRGDGYVPPRQMPPGTPDLTGRAREVAELVERLLARAERRDAGPVAAELIAVCGPGGVGKTTLAAQVGHQVAVAFTDGQLYADLRGETAIEVTSRVHAAFLRALGVDGSAVPEDPDEREAMYRSRVADRRLLIVLDDVASERQVARLLPGSRRCAVIVTSRRRLGGLPGAHHLELEPLHQEDSLELLRRITGNERVAAEFDAASKLAALCDGLPLALRLVGARLASRPHWRFGDVATRLSDEARRLDELSYGGLEFRSAIAVTSRSLSKEARRLFGLLSLLPGPDFPAWTAAALLDAGLAEADALLDELVDVQLLTATWTTISSTDILRYRFHSLVHVYAAEQLELDDADGSDRMAGLRRLLGGWLAQTEDVHRAAYGGDFTILHGEAPRWRPHDGTPLPPMSSPFALLDLDRRAIVGAITYAAAMGLHEHCWDLALTAIGLFEHMGSYDEWKQTSTVALEAVERADNRLGRTAMTYSLGSLQLNLMRLDPAERLLGSALDGFRLEGLPQGVGLALAHLGLVHDVRGDVRAMRDCYAQGLSALRAAGDRVGEAGALGGLAKVAMKEGELATAHQLLSEAWEILEQTQSRRSQAQALHSLARLYEREGELELARRTQLDVLERVRDLGDQIGEVHALYGLAVILHRGGDVGAARTTLVRALELADLRGVALIEAKSRHALGEIAASELLVKEAVDQLTQAQRLFAAIGAVPLRAQALLALAGVQLSAGQTDLAQECMEEVELLLPALDPGTAGELLLRLEAMRAPDAS